MQVACTPLQSKKKKKIPWIKSTSVIVLISKCIFHLTAVSEDSVSTRVGHMIKTKVHAIGYFLLIEFKGLTVYVPTPIVFFLL